MYRCTNGRPVNAALDCLNARFNFMLTILQRNGQAHYQLDVLSELAGSRLVPAIAGQSWEEQFFVTPDALTAWRQHLRLWISRPQGRQ